MLAQLRTLIDENAKRKGGRSVRADGAAAGAADHAARRRPHGGSAPRADFLAGEEPLGIRVDGTALTLTMRTPGDDLALAAGFLVSEAVIRSPADIAEIKLCDGTACGQRTTMGPTTTGWATPPR